MVTGIVLSVDVAIVALVLGVSAAAGMFWPKIWRGVSSQCRQAVLTKTGADPLNDLFEKETLAALIAQVNPRNQTASQHQMMAALRAVWAEDTAASAETLPEQSRITKATLLPAANSRESRNNAAA